MGLLGQLSLAILIGVACTCFHIAVMAWLIPRLSTLGTFCNRRLPRLRVVVVLSTAFIVVMISHLIQIGGWTAVLSRLGVFTDLGDALYFSIVTYTTVGYGDVVAGGEWRILAALGSFTGLMTFGVSTAFFFGVVTRLLPVEEEAKS